MLVQHISYICNITKSQAEIIQWVTRCTNVLNVSSLYCKSILLIKALNKAQ